MNPFLVTDSYKTGHPWMYPEGTEVVYSNFTPRSMKYAPSGVEKIVSFGQQLVMKQIHELFDNDFFEVPKKVVIEEIKREYDLHLGTDFDTSKIEALHDLGYLPIMVKALPEGIETEVGVPVLTIYNTKPEFYWLTNFLETMISNLLWKPIVSASIAHQYKKDLTRWALKTDKENIGFVDFQGHDFSMRGLSGVDSVIQSGLGHAISFLGSDSLPVIHGARKYYYAKDFVVGSVNATEHSVMSAGGKGDEIGTFRRLLSTFPKGILSVVSDTWNLWKVLTDYLPTLKKEILARDGKLVIRPDSGDPVDILCGETSSYIDIPDNNEFNDFLIDIAEYQGDTIYYNNKYYEVGDIEEYEDDYGKGNVYESWAPGRFHELLLGNKIGVLEEVFPDVNAPEKKGVIELLWDEFGGTTNSQGYKVLDPHIGCIYGDSITLDRAKAICARLEAKGFASTNVVLGIGSYTYQYNTRDTFGLAMKATYAVIKGQGKEIFKDPITDDGTKKSAKGLIQVNLNTEEGYLDYKDQVTWQEEKASVLKAIYKDGEFKREWDFSTVRSNLERFVDE